MPNHGPSLTQLRNDPVNSNDFASVVRSDAICIERNECADHAVYSQFAGSLVRFRRWPVSTNDRQKFGTRQIFMA